MFLLKKNYKLIILILFLLLMLVYVASITSVPNTLILFQNEQFNFKRVLGLKIEEVLEVGANITDEESSNFQSVDSKNKKHYTLSFLGFNLKTITANIISDIKVIPLGNLVGLKLHTKGVLVVGMSEIQGKDNKIYKPYEQSGIEQGDSIIEINNEVVNTTDELIECVSKCKGNDIEITYIKDGNVLNAKITPIETSKNTYKIGLWVRDAAAGVGTLTFYDPSTNSFAALGHGIQDVDTEELVEISSGEFVTADVVDIEKGEKGNPGKIEGTIENSTAIGNIYSNTEYGIYGFTIDEKELNINNVEELEVASRNEITLGKASIICALEDGVRKEYEVEIDKIYINNNENNKSMVVKVTDKELLEKTGGIIQGMSGSPIIQNGKIVGALTHVFVSDPSKRIWCICRFNDKAN